MSKADSEELLQLLFKVSREVTGKPNWQPSPMFGTCDDWILAGICLLIVIYIFRAMMKKGV